MALLNINPTATKSWNELEKHFIEMNAISIKEMFLKDKDRAEKFHLKWNDFIVDYSKTTSIAKQLICLYNWQIKQV